jgi:hypothetical protein
MVVLGPVRKHNWSLLRFPRPVGGTYRRDDLRLGEGWFCESAEGSSKRS